MDASRAAGGAPMSRRSGRGRRRWGRRIAATLLALALGGAGYVYWTEKEAVKREAHIATLEATRDRLRERLGRLREKDPLVASAPEGGVLIGIGEGFGSQLLSQATTGFLGQVELVLKNLKVHKAGRVRVKTPLGRMTPGHYVLDVRIEEVRGILEPGPVKLDFGRGRADVSFPVRVARGEGRARLRFQWDSRGLAGAFCDDFTVTTRVGGHVRPRTYPVEGSFDLSMAGGTLTAVPRFPDLVVNLEVEPSEESWAEVERVLGRRSLKCRMALKLVDVRQALERLLDKGFKVRVPQKILKPVRFPVGLRQSVVLEGRTYDLAVTPRALRISPKRLWYGADVTAEAAGAPLEGAVAPPPALPATAEPASVPETTPAAAPAPTPEATAAPAPPTGVEEESPAPPPSEEAGEAPPAEPTPTPTPPPGKGERY